MTGPQDRQSQAAAPPWGYGIGPLDSLPGIVLPNQKSEVVSLLDYMVGNMVVLLVVADPREPACMTQLRRFAERWDAIQRRANLFVVTSTPPEVNAALPGPPLPFYLLSDVKGELAGLISSGRPDAGLTALIVSERMRILRIDRGVTDPDYASAVLAFLDSLPRPAARVQTGFAPVLQVPQVLEPELCNALIRAHQTQGAEQSKAPTVIGGELTQVLTAGKIRRDHLINDRQTITALMERFTKRVQPEILRAFTRQVSGVEECKVVCYEASTGGHFKAHRDNTMAHFAHRRFAMSVNLNTGDYEGGFLRFPEYGPDLYMPAKGEAVIYSSSLLHEVTPVTSGRRFALILHLFDEESRQRSPLFRR